MPKPPRNPKRPRPKEMRFDQFAEALKPIRKQLAEQAAAKIPSEIQVAVQKIKELRAQHEREYYRDLRDSGPHIGSFFRMREISEEIKAVQAGLFDLKRAQLNRMTSEELIAEAKKVFVLEGLRELSRNTRLHPRGGKTIETFITVLFHNQSVKIIIIEAIARKYCTLF